MGRRGACRRWGALLRIVQSCLWLAIVFGTPGVATGSGEVIGPTYTNPLTLQGSDGSLESCPDPAIIHGQQPGDTAWYLYCTTDPIGGTSGFHLIPMLRSLDLVHWMYLGDAFSARPAWASSRALLWAPEIQFFNDRYYLYFTVTNTTLPGGGSAIGVATSASPTGPWTESGAPVVEPHAAPCCPDARTQVYDPAIVTDETGQRYLFYGSYSGGIAARRLSADGLHTDPTSDTTITVPHRYEGTSIVRHAGFYYLFVSAADCCNGPVTGYSVFTGRAANVLGPYTDRDGVSLLASAVGGTPVLSMNGNRWIGTGHITAFTDVAGQDWVMYHAVDRTDPFFANVIRFTRRPALLDPLDWRDGWPTVRGGFGASDTPQPAPAAQSGDRGDYIAASPNEESPGLLAPAFSEDFSPPPAIGNVQPPAILSGQWRWVRPPDAWTYGISDGTLHMQTQAGDLYKTMNSASVLAEPTPAGEYIVETRVHLDVPEDECCHNFVQAGLVIYGDDDNYIKLVDTAQWGTRQTEFAKEMQTLQPGAPRYGSTAVGSPGSWTYLRIVKRNQEKEERYTAYTSRDGTHWVRSGTWTDTLGPGARIGLVAMGGAGFTAAFDYVRVYTLPMR